jgi:hypothetical protein
MCAPVQKVPELVGTYAYHVQGIVVLSQVYFIFCGINCALTLGESPHSDHLYTCVPPPRPTARA